MLPSCFPSQNTSDFICASSAPGWGVRISLRGKKSNKILWPQWLFGFYKFHYMIHDLQIKRKKILSWVWAFFKIPTQPQNGTLLSNRI